MTDFNDNQPCSQSPKEGRSDDSNDPYVDRYRMPGDNGRHSREHDGGGKRRHHWNDRDKAES